MDFLVHARHDFKTDALRSYTSSHPTVLKYELVSMRAYKKKLCYIEFVDERDNHYHLINTRVNLSEEEILDMVKNRWCIELFFKWIKQQLKVSHLLSESSIGIWN